MHCYSPWSNSRFSNREKQQSECTLIWKKLIQKWNPSDRKLLKCAKSMTKYAPIPTTLRKKAWFVMSGAAELFRNNPCLYTKLHSSDSLSTNLITRDLSRTYKKHDSSLKKMDLKSLQKGLCRILTAYSNFDPSLGYCQGMNYIAAFLLYIFHPSHEERAFWTFVVIMRQIRSLFIDGLPGFHQLVEYFRKLCKYHLPSLYLRWDSHDIDIFKLILTKWFHSMFSSQCLDSKHVSRLFDLFLTHDFSVYVKFSFTLIACNESKLSQMDLVDVIEWCNVLPCMKRNGDRFIQKSICIQLNEKYMKYTRDLTLFDWQMNKEMDKEYMRRKQCKQAKENKKIRESSSTLSESTSTITISALSESETSESVGALCTIQSMQLMQ